MWRGLNCKTNHQAHNGSVVWLGLELEPARSRAGAGTMQLQWDVLPGWGCSRNLLQSAAASREKRAVQAADSSGSGPPLSSTSKWAHRYLPEAITTLMAMTATVATSQHGRERGLGLVGAAGQQAGAVSTLAHSFLKRHHSQWDVVTCRGRNTVTGFLLTNQISFILNQDRDRIYNYKYMIMFWLQRSILIFSMKKGLSHCASSASDVTWAKFFNVNVWDIKQEQN